MTTGNEPPVPGEGGPDTTPTPTPEQLRMRDGRHRFTRNPATAANDLRAAQLRAQGWTYQRIAEELGYNPKTGKSAAIDAVRRGGKDITREAGKELLEILTDRLETLYEKAVDVSEREHIVVSHGKIIRDDGGRPLRDSGPELAAIREARATLESFRKLLGLDAPSRVSVEAEQLGREIGRLLDTALGPDETGDGDNPDA